MPARARTRARVRPQSGGLNVHASGGLNVHADAAQPGAGTTRPGAEPQTQATRPRAGPITFGGLKWVSFGHSCVYLSLLVCAFAIGKPEPLTDVLGWSHGLLWIGMSLTCITAARLRIVPLRLAVAVGVLGGIGPFFGSYEFVREQRRRAAIAAAASAVAGTATSSPGSVTATAAGPVAPAASPRAS